MKTKYHCKIRGMNQYVKANAKGHFALQVTNTAVNNTKHKSHAPLSDGRMICPKFMSSHIFWQFHRKQQVLKSFEIECFVQLIANIICFVNGFYYA